jgi:hypothetical protein
MHRRLHVPLLRQRRHYSQGVALSDHLDHFGASGLAGLHLGLRHGAGLSLQLERNIRVGLPDFAVSSVEQEGDANALPNAREPPFAPPAQGMAGNRLRRRYFPAARKSLSSFGFCD